MQISKSSLKKPTGIIDSIQTNVLLDITQNVNIKSDFCITHPEYKPFKPSIATVKQLQKLPTEVQQKYLSSQLQYFIYGIYYNGSLKRHLLLNKQTSIVTSDKGLENDIYSNPLSVEQDLYEQLHLNNNGKGYFDPGWQIIKQNCENKTLLVTKKGLTLHIKYNHAKKDKFTSLNQKKIISVKLPKNKIQNGFYIAVGNAGLYSQNNSYAQRKIVRVYFNVTADSASLIMNSLTKQLNNAFIPFSFKALYNSLSYDERCDSAVLYFERGEYDRVKCIIQSIYLKHRVYFQAPTPLFAKILAPGLGLAEEPNQKFVERESFGQNRCQIIAKSLLETKFKGNDTSEERMAAIIRNFSLLGIDLHHPYLNYNSEDIYTPLEL